MKSNKEITHLVRKSSRALKHRSLPCFWPGSGMWHLLTSKILEPQRQAGLHLRQSQMHKKHFSLYCYFVCISPILKYPVAGSYQVGRSPHVCFRIKTNGAALNQWLLLSKSYAKLLWLQTAIFMRVVFFFPFLFAAPQLDVCWNGFKSEKPGFP